MLVSAGLPVSLWTFVPGSTPKELRAEFWHRTGTNQKGVDTVRQPGKFVKRSLLPLQSTSVLAVGHRNARPQFFVNSQQGTSSNEFCRIIAIGAVYIQ